MSASSLTPAQRAALNRARELAAELAYLTAAVRAVLREGASPAVEAAAPDAPAPELTGLEAGELRAAFAQASRGGRPRRPRELFGR